MADIRKHPSGDPYSDPGHEGNGSGSGFDGRSGGDIDHRLRQVERDVDRIPGLLREQAAEIKGEIREGRAESKGQHEVINAKLKPLATREYVANRGWILIALLVAILGLLFRVWQSAPQAP